MTSRTIRSVVWTSRVTQTFISFEQASTTCHRSALITQNTSTASAGCVLSSSLSKITQPSRSATKAAIDMVAKGERSCSSRHIYCRFCYHSLVILQVWSGLPVAAHHARVPTVFGLISELSVQMPQHNDHQAAQTASRVNRDQILVDVDRTIRQHKHTRCGLLFYIVTPSVLSRSMISVVARWHASSSSALAWGRTLISVQRRVSCSGA